MITAQNHLAYLETADLIRLAQQQPEVEYLFRHALVQDAAYESLLRKDRRQLTSIMETEGKLASSLTFPAS
jgi:predicted ATPase